MARAVRDTALGRLGLSPTAIVCLAALGLPRVVAHDLELVGPAVNFVLAVAPVALWLLAALRADVPNPFVALLTVGLVYGLLLAVTHQLLWTEAFDGDPPRLGGNLADLPDAAHAVVTRCAAFLSSLATGALVGAIAGAVALAIARGSSRRPSGAR